MLERQAQEEKKKAGEARMREEAAKREAVEERRLAEEEKKNAGEARRREEAAKREVVEALRKAEEETSKCLELEAEIQQLRAQFGARERA